MAEKTARRPALFSYDYFLSKKNNPRTAGLYYFYVFCYTSGLRTVRMFRRAAVSVQEFFRFVSDRIIRTLLIRIREATYGRAKKAAEKYRAAEKRWFSEKAAELSACEAARDSLPAPGSGSCGESAQEPAEYAKKIRTLRRQIARRRLFNFSKIAAPVICAAALAVTLAVWNSYDAALLVEYDGKKLGYISNEGIYDLAVARIEDIIVGVDKRYNFTATPLYTIKHVRNAQVRDADQFADVFLSAVMGSEVQKAYGVFINDDFRFSVMNGGSLQDYLDSLLVPYLVDEKDTTVGFYDDIEVSKGIYPTETVIGLDDAKGILGHVETAEVRYTCARKDTTEKIAEKNGVPEEVLMKYNPDIAGRIRRGAVITLKIPHPYLQIKKSVLSTYTEDIPYDRVTKYTSSKFEGFSQVTTKGRVGRQTVTAHIIYVDGAEVSREIISTEVLKKPRTEIKTVGTKTVPKYAPSIEDYNGITVTGKFMWPVDGGRITCRWYGYPGHKGLDIGAPKGTKIYASDGGVVVYTHHSRRSYGNQILIDHGNGYVTRYAHCTKLLVEVGDAVEKGQNIATVGSTGHTTGPHLHFEVIIEGERVNPEKYITS